MTFADEDVPEETFSSAAAAGAAGDTFKADGTGGAASCAGGNDRIACANNACGVGDNFTLFPVGAFVFFVCATGAADVAFGGEGVGAVCGPGDACGGGNFGDSSETCDAADISSVIAAGVAGAFSCSIDGARDACSASGGGDIGGGNEACGCGRIGGVSETCGAGNTCNFSATSGTGAFVCTTGGGVDTCGGTDGIGVECGA